MQINNESDCTSIAVYFEFRSLNFWIEKEWDNDDDFKRREDGGITIKIKLIYKLFYSFDFAGW